MTLTINNAYNHKHYKILTQKTEAVAPLQKEDGTYTWPEDILTFIEAMKETLKETPEGIALAATQVWSDTTKVCPSIFVVKMEDDSIKEFINPEVKGTGKSFKLEEGCLSLPKQVFKKRRAKNATVIFNTMKDPVNPQALKFSGFYSQVMQHEYGHLQGILIRKVVHARS